MTSPTLQRRLGIGLGVVALCGGSLALGYVARAQGAPQAFPGATSVDPAQYAEPPSPEGVTRPRGRGGRAPQATPAPGVPFAGFGGMGGYGGSFTFAPPHVTAMTAAGNNVVVLRGNTLYSFDARSLKPNASTELPAPEPGGPPMAGGLGVAPTPGPGGFFTERAPRLDRRPSRRGGGYSDVAPEATTLPTAPEPALAPVPAPTRR